MRTYDDTGLEIFGCGRLEVGREALGDTDATGYVAVIRRDRTGPTRFDLRNYSAAVGATVQAQYEVRSNVARLVMSARGSGNTSTLCGIPQASWSNILEVANVGLLIATLGSAPVVIGTNNVECARFEPAGTLAMAAPIRLKSYTVATLPAGTQGDVAYVTDAAAPAYLAAVVAGGAVKVPVFYNGAAWVCF